MVKCNEKQNQSFFHLEGLVLLILDQYNFFYSKYLFVLWLLKILISTQNLVSARNGTKDRTEEKHSGKANERF